MRESTGAVPSRLLAMLNALLESIDDDATQAICGQLDGLTAKLNQWVGGDVLTAAQAEPLLNSASNLKKTRTAASSRASRRQHASF